MPSSASGLSSRRHGLRCDPHRAHPWGPPGPHSILCPNPKSLPTCSCMPAAAPHLQYDFLWFRRHVEDAFGYFAFLLFYLLTGMAAPHPCADGALLVAPLVAPRAGIGVLAPIVALPKARIWIRCSSACRSASARSGCSRLVRAAGGDLLLKRRECRLHFGAYRRIPRRPRHYFVLRSDCSCASAIEAKRRSGCVHAVRN